MAALPTATRRLIPLLLCCGLGCQPVDSADPAVEDASDVDAATPDDMALGRPDFFVGVDLDLPDAEGSPDLGPPDAELVTPDAEIPDMELPDAAPPSPVDVICPQPWIDLDDRAPRACDGRRVHTLDPGFDVRTVAIARSGQGRLAFGWGIPDFADGGEYVVQVVNEDDLSRVVAHTIRPESPIGEETGYRASLAALRETFHLVTWKRGDFGSAVLYRQIRPDGVLSTREIVDDLVGTRGSLDMLVNAQGDVEVGWHDKQSGTFKIRRRASDGTWDDTFTLDTDLGETYEGDGAMALTLDPEDRLHVAYELALSRFGTAPRARARIGQSWTLRRTLDNFTNTRVSGLGLDLVALADERIAIYLDWLDGTGEIRLARWSTSEGDPTIEILEPGLPLDEPPFRFPLALAVDDQGLLHAVLLNVGGANTDRLEYRRQIRLGGRLEWLVDVIDDDVERSGLYVDLVMDGRTPHILYFDPRNGYFAYATAR